MLSIMRETTTVQKAIYRNQLRDDDDCLDYMMKQPNIMPRLNDRILKADNAAFVDLTGRVALKMRRKFYRTCKMTYSVGKMQRKFCGTHKTALIQ